MRCPSAWTTRASAHSYRLTARRRAKTSKACSSREASRSQTTTDRTAKTWDASSYPRGIHDGSDGNGRILGIHAPHLRACDHQRPDRRRIGIRNPGTEAGTICAAPRYHHQVYGAAHDLAFRKKTTRADPMNGGEGIEGDRREHSEAIQQGTRTRRKQTQHSFQSRTRSSRQRTA